MQDDSQPPKRPIFQIIALIIALGLIAVSLMLPDSVSETLESGALSFTLGQYQLSLFKILQTLLIIGVALWAVKLLIRLADRSLSRFSQIRASSRLLMVRILQSVLYFVLFLVILSNLGIDLTALAIFSGTIGIGLGFGLQKIASNFISGLILTSEGAITVGDLLELNDGVIGFVRRIGARQILLEGLDNKEIMVPNEEFINTRVTNWTYSNHKARVDVRFGVAYGTDLPSVIKIVTDIANAHPLRSVDSDPSCHVTAFGDSSIDFILYFWIDEVIRGIVRTRSELLLSIWSAFKEHNIQIPFPQRDVHMIAPADAPVSAHSPDKTAR